MDRNIIDQTVKAIHTHARKCKKNLADCDMCQHNIEFFSKLPKVVLSEVLREK